MEKFMVDIIHILIVIFVAGFLLWLVNKAPLQETFKQILNGVAIVALVIWLVVQLLPYLHGFH
jgi:hypothetical protein